MSFHNHSQDCTYVVDASPGCAGHYPCNVSLVITGETEQDRDYVSVWRVTNRTDPTAGTFAMDAEANRIALLSGQLRYNQTLSTPTGMLVVNFMSDPFGTASGWEASWSVVGVKRRRKLVEHVTVP